jgi:hypothetical protein
MSQIVIAIARNTACREQPERRIAWIRCGTNVPDGRFVVVASGAGAATGILLK